jgi:hypothetical protein
MKTSFVMSLFILLKYILVLTTRKVPEYKTDYLQY